MQAIEFTTGNLVLYKSRPAIISDVGEKITIKLDKNKAKRVRQKDISLLHPGPVNDLSGLNARETDVVDAWELLEDETTSLAELTELLFDDFTPETAWSAWKLVDDGVYFEGVPDEIRGRQASQVQADLDLLKKKQQEEAEKQLFFEHIRQGKLTDSDRKRLAEVEMLALMKTDKSRILQELDIKQTRESAHQFLVKCGYWAADFNPYPQRLGVSLASVDLEIGELPDEKRRDLTHLTAYAIDDENSNDPDDAISMDGERLWVHVADVAALVKPGTALDTEALERAANLYLPDRVVHMLPESLTQQLGLGLQTMSPALSIGFVLTDDGVIDDVEIVLSQIKVTRLSYQQADLMLDESIFPQVMQITERFRQKRFENHASELDLPEVSIRVRQGQVAIQPIEKLKSRQLVTDAMLMAGAATAAFAQRHNIPIPYASQPPPETFSRPESLSEMFAYRRQFKASQSSLVPEPHSGLGLESYTRATSPMRRYLDLLTHQQIRAFLNNGEILDADDISMKIARVDPVSATIRRAERLSNNHWKLVYLQQNPQWQGNGVVVDQDERKTTLLIPELALETKIRSRDPLSLDDTIPLKFKHADIPGLVASFQRLD